MVFPKRIRWAFALLWVGLSACAGPEPRRFPPAWMERRVDPVGMVEQRYDLDADGAVDYAEVLGREGRVVAIKFVRDANGRESTITLDDTPEDQRLDLVILLDSVPFEIVEELWRQGRFRLFHPPSRVIAPFPVMTDLSFSEFFGASPTPGVEAVRYDGNALHGGTDSYVSLENSPWVDYVDYFLDFRKHGFAYFWPGMWFDHELRHIGELRMRSSKSDLVGYCVGTSAYGAKYGRNGHVEAMIRLDRYCQALVHDSRGRIRISLLSDHGHDLLPARRIPLSERLVDFGYRVTCALERPEDVVVPEFGMVSCAAIHTRSPERVAADVVGLQGVELAAYLGTAGEVIVLNRGGRGRIRQVGAGLVYEPEFGDPLKLGSLVPDAAAGRRHVDVGSFDSRQWFELTVDHEFPDVVPRLWRAFHGLVQHTPSVLLSLEDGYFCGSADLAAIYPMSAAHGNLGRLSSTAFAMSMAGALPAALRMEELRSELEGIGVKIGTAALRR